MRTSPDSLTLIFLIGFMVRSSRGRVLAWGARAAKQFKTGVA